MKKVFLLCVVAAAFIAGCSKDEPVPAGNNNVVTVQFNSDTAATYYFATRLDSLSAFDSANATSFQADYLFSNLPTATGDTLRFTVYPPNTWIGTTSEAMVSLKLFVGGVEKASDTATITGADRPGGFTIYTVL